MTSTTGQIERTRGIVAACVGLLIMTGLEVGLVNLPVDRAARVTALVGLAMTKVLVMLLAFMRLGHESRLLRTAALVPLILAPAFAVALMLDAVFRVTQR
jgi:heme/copper-type cytochrome/quinol oxidase subunit 4